MARYRKVDVRVWVDARFLSLSPIPPCGQGLWLHLLTSPDSNMIPGLYRSGQAALAEALGWPLEAFREVFREVEAQGMARADWTARVVWLPKALSYDPPQSPNVVVGWADHWDEIPDCPLKATAWGAFLAHFEEGARLKREALKPGDKTDPDAFLVAFQRSCPKPSAKPLPNQEQEQESGEGTGTGERGPEPDASDRTPAACGRARSGAKAKGPKKEREPGALEPLRVIARRVFTHYAEMYAVCRELRGEPASTPRQTDRTLDRFVALLQDGYTEEDLLDAASGMPFSKWHMGFDAERDAKLGVDRVYSITGKANQVEKLRDLAKAPPRWAIESYQGTRLAEMRPDLWPVQAPREPWHVRMRIGERLRALAMALPPWASTIAERVEDLPSDLLPEPLEMALEPLGRELSALTQARAEEDKTLEGHKDVVREWWKTQGHLHRLDKATARQRCEERLAVVLRDAYRVPELNPYSEFVEAALGAD